MKKFVDVEQGMGDGKLKAALGIDQADLVVQVEARIPAVKVIEPATKAVDNLLDKLEKAIPGDWDKPMIDTFKAEYKQDLVKYLEEKA